MSQDEDDQKEQCNFILGLLYTILVSASRIAAPPATTTSTTRGCFVACDGCIIDQVFRLPGWLERFFLRGFPVNTVFRDAASDTFAGKAPDFPGCFFISAVVTLPRWRRSGC